MSQVEIVFTNSKIVLLNPEKGDGWSFIQGGSWIVVHRADRTSRHPATTIFGIYTERG